MDNKTHVQGLKSRKGYSDFGDIKMGKPCHEYPEFPVTGGKGMSGGMQGGKKGKNKPSKGY